MKTSSNSNNSNNNKLLVPSSPIISISNGSNCTHNNNQEIENGLDFILKHFDQDRLFPRTIMTKKLGHQKEVFSKKEAAQFFKESDFIDCRINAFPSYTDYKGIQRYPPDLIFIDIDKKDFKTSIGFEVALFTTLKNVKVKLKNSNKNDIYPTVLKTGRGYHIILPIECPIVLENVKEFQKYKNDKPSQEFLRFAKDFLSDDKADKNNNPSFKSCLLRIPGSINSKYNIQVKILQKWNNYRPNISIELLLDFRRYLKNKNRQKTVLVSKPNRSNNNTNNFHNDTYYEWINKKILANSFQDYRKVIINLILTPYLIVIKKLSYEESYQIINLWLQKCDLLSGRRLDFNKKFLVTIALITAYKKQIPPMKMITLKTNYNDLYFILVQKEKEERVG